MSAYVECYEATGRDPLALGRQLRRLDDIRLELFYIAHFDVLAYGWYVLEPTGPDVEDSNSALAMLSKQAIDQSIITRSRILWERIMNFVALVEGEDIGRGRSKKGRFKKRIAERREQWRWMLPHLTEVDAYDDVYRTHEVHGNSVLAEAYRRQDPIDTGDLMSLVNMTISGVWSDILSSACDSDSGSGVVAAV